MKTHVIKYIVWSDKKYTKYLFTFITENGVKDPRIDRAIGVCKKTVSAFSYSWKKRRDMTELQAELGLPQHLLISESPTRWGSRQKMIERFLEQEKAITRVLGADKKKRHLVPTWQDLEVLEATNKAVKPLQDFTDALSGESYVSVSCIKPVLQLFLNKSPPARGGRFGANKNNQS